MNYAAQFDDRQELHITGSAYIVAYFVIAMFFLAGFMAHWILF